MDEKELQSIKELALSTQDLLVTANGFVNALMSAVTALATSHPDKPAFLKALSAEMEKAVVTDLFGPCPPQVTVRYEGVRNHVAAKLLEACRTSL